MPAVAGPSVATGSERGRTVGGRACARGWGIETHDQFRDQDPARRLERLGMDEAPTAACPETAVKEETPATSRTAGQSRVRGWPGPLTGRGHSTPQDQSGVGPDVLAAGSRVRRRPAVRQSASPARPRYLSASGQRVHEGKHRQRPCEGTRSAKQSEAAKTSATDRAQKTAVSKIARKKPASKQEPSDSPNEPRGAESPQSNRCRLTREGNGGEAR